MTAHALHVDGDLGGLTTSLGSSVRPTTPVPFLRTEKEKVCLWQPDNYTVVLVIRQK